jgi:hypothetical protein
MWNRTLPLLATLALVATAHAQDERRPRYVTIEQAIEARSDALRLPDRTPATLIARTCSTCPEMNLQVSEKTQFVLGKTVVKQSEFNERVRREAVDLGVFYNHKTFEINRLVAFGVTVARAK